MIDSASAGAAASAPGKVILFGEHFVVYGTDAILCAIDRRAYVTASRSRGIRITSEMGTLERDTARSSPDEIDPVLRPLYHIAREALGASGLDGGITLSVRSEIPPGAGLGSSSACCVAGAAAALRALGADAPQDRIMKLAVDAERTAFPGASGADTAASLLGGMIIYNRGTGYKILETSQNIGFGLVISDSGIRHNTEEVVRRVAGFRDKNPAEFRGLCKKESDLISCALGMLGLGRYAGDQIPIALGLGRIASLNQEYLRKIGVSNKLLDDMISKMDGLAYGSKITGAGGGGCIIGFAGAEDARRQGQESGAPMQAPPAVSHMLPSASESKKAGSVAGLLSEAGQDCFAAKIDIEGLVNHTCKEVGRYRILVNFIGHWYLM